MTGWQEMYGGQTLACVTGAQINSCPLFKVSPNMLLIPVSIYYIMMVYDHMMYFGRTGEVSGKTHLPVLMYLILMHVWTTGSRVGKIVRQANRDRIIGPYLIVGGMAGTTGVQRDPQRSATMESLLYILGSQTRRRFRICRLKIPAE